MYFYFFSFRFFFFRLANAPVPTFCGPVFLTVHSSPSGVSVCVCVCVCVADSHTGRRARNTHARAFVDARNVGEKVWSEMSREFDVERVRLGVAVFFRARSHRPRFRSFLFSGHEGGVSVWFVWCFLFSFQRGAENRN